MAEDHENDQGKSAETSENDKDEEINTSRRKAISNFLPFVIGSLSQAQKVISPADVAERAVAQYDEYVSKKVSNYQEYLKQKLPQLGSATVTLEGETGFSVTLDRNQVLSGIIEEYVKQFSLDERWFDYPFSVIARNQVTELVDELDSELSLPRGSVNIKLLKEKPMPSLLPSIQARMLKAKSSETWLVVLSGVERNEEQDFLLDPLFASEKHFLPGRILVLGLNTIVSERIQDETYVIGSSQTQEGKIKVNFTEVS